MSDVMRIFMYFFSFLSFLDTLFMYLRSCYHVMIANLVLIDIYIYIYLRLLLQFFHLSLHVLFLFSLYAHDSYSVCNLLFLFHTKMP